MDSRRERTRPLVLLLNSVDRLGRTVDPSVLAVAQEIAPRAVLYGERLLRDPALALSFFEEAAASTSEAIKEKQQTGSPPVRDIGAYLFRTFIRIVDKAKQRETSLDRAVQQYAEAQLTLTDQGRAETAILVNEIMAACDQVSREIILLRLRDQSWDEIGKHFGISPYAAEARYRKALDRARKTLKIQK